MLAWSLLSPRFLTNEIMLNIMQNFKFDYSKTNFRPTGVYISSSISRTLHKFSMGFFSMYRGVLGLKSYTSILRKNGSFTYKTCCSLTALFVKTKINFLRCNFGNNQIKIPSIIFSYSQMGVKNNQKLQTLLLHLSHST